MKAHTADVSAQSPAAKHYVKRQRPAYFQDVYDPVALALASFPVRCDCSFEQKGQPAVGLANGLAVAIAQTTVAREGTRASTTCRSLESS